MDKDLAPKRSYVYILLTAGLGIIVTSIVHQRTMDIAMKSHNFAPFILTTSICLFFFLTFMLIFNRCRYVTTISDTNERLEIGNLFSHNEAAHDRLIIVGKIFGPLFRITIDQRTYFILSSDKRVDAYRDWVGR